MRSQSVRISSLNWSVGDWRAGEVGGGRELGPGSREACPTARGQGLAGGWRLWRRPGSRLVQDSESRGGDRVEAAAPGADRQKSGG